MDNDGISALLTEQGWALLESLPPYDPSQAIALGEELRRQGQPADLVAAALTQSRLRAAATEKFGPFAASMLFTRAGLEQASRFQVAARHAQRFVGAGIEKVADLGCGIGADAMALATFEREVLAVDRDEVTAAAATMNLRHWPNATVRCADVTELTEAELSGFGGAFLDPARREATTGKRLLDPRFGSPPLSFVLDLATRLPAVGVKTAPGIPHHLVPEGAEAQWISVAGSVVEAGLWFGSLARDGVRRAALVLPRDGDESTAAAEVTDVGMDDASTGPIGAVLYEPDGAVIRAGLVAQVATQVNGRLLDPTIAYVTADSRVSTSLATAYAVEEVFPFQLKRLRTWLRDRDVARLTIKKRGTAIEPEQLRRQLRLDAARGSNEATIVLTRVAGKQSVIAVRPFPDRGR